MPSLFIGMPVLNGEKHIQKALNSLLGQSFKDWKLQISDNCSDDATGSIAEEYAHTDSRILYQKQLNRYEAEPNFEFLLKSADTEYFMWAAHDDVWHKDFILRLMEGLRERNEFGMAFCNIQNIDEDGQLIRSYPSFKRFQCDNHFDSIVNFLRDPEIFGKANLIYSIYRTELIKRLYQEQPKDKVWGSDMVLVFRCLCKTRALIEENVLFYKRIRRAELTHIKNPDHEVFPYIDAEKYVSALVQAARGSPYENVTRTIMELRRDLLGKTIAMDSFERQLKKRKLVRIAWDRLKSRK